jgi:DNA-binding MarR family transcriptional regulator
MSYRPLDEILSRPRMQILRALRWFDAVTSEELLLAVNAPDYDHARNPERNNYTHNLRRLVKDGLVESDEAEWPYRYRITPKGRDAIRALRDNYNRALEAA